MLTAIESPVLPAVMTGRPVQCGWWQRALYQVDGLRTQQAVGCETNPRVYAVAVALAGLLAFGLLVRGKGGKKGWL